MKAKELFSDEFILKLAQSKTKKLTPEQWAHIHELDHGTLDLLNYILRDEVAQHLNKNGYANKTVCPSCHVDDFTHVESCPNQF